MLTSTAKNLSYDEAKSNSQKAKKDIKLVIFFFTFLLTFRQIIAYEFKTDFLKKIKEGMLVQTKNWLI